jgi:hypothetical protein
MLFQVFCDLQFDGRKYLFHMNSSIGKQFFLRKKNTKHMFTNTESNENGTPSVPF